MIASDQIKLNVHNNASQPEESAVLHVSPSLPLAGLIREAGEKVGVARPVKAYVATGMELDNPEVLRNNDHVYISAGEKFYKQDQAQDSSLLRLSILGGGGVGKSAITLRFVRDFFVQNWEATIEDAYRKTTRVDDQTVTIEILDTAGQEDFSTLRAQWMMDKEGYIFVYSLVDRESVEQLHSFIELLEQVCMGLPVVPPIIFVGNKKDLTDVNPSRRSVAPDDVAFLMKACEEVSNRVKLQANPDCDLENSEGWSMLHFEASALSGEKIDQMFEILVREITDRKNRVPALQKKKKKKSSSWFGKWCTIL
jgi:small GTP-binding protein